MVKTFRIIVLVLLPVIAFNAFYGSWLLISDPGGNSIGISIDLLQHTPFEDYLWPGIILFAANGALSVLTAILTTYKVDHYPWFIVLQGCVLIGWLTGELILNMEFFHPALHYPFYAMGILLIASGFIINMQEGPGRG